MLGTEHRDADLVRGDWRYVDLGPVSVVDLDGVAPRLHRIVLSDAVSPTSFRRGQRETDEARNGRVQAVAGEQVSSGHPRDPDLVRGLVE